VLALASRTVTTKPANSLQLMADGSAADPASLGVAVVLANWTIPVGNVSQSAFGQAAEEQVRALLENTPKTEDGAISHRVEEVALW
jgi:hypothetical protein